MIDLVDRNPMEVEFLFRKPVERASRLGVPVPHLQTLVFQIEAFQRFHNLF
jgi:ketopantoate reductase